MRTERGTTTNDDGMTGTPHRSCEPASPTTGNDPRPRSPTRPQPCEQLFAGWIAGATIQRRHGGLHERPGYPGRRRRRDCTNAQGAQDDDDHLNSTDHNPAAPRTTAMSDCLRGGSGEQQRGQGRGETRRKRRGPKR
jgi:hypothetical protein